jgi:glycosyltransferase involved in cell wall biosynthesis
MKVHLLDTDSRIHTDPNYPVNHGSFSEVMINLNNALKEIDCYAEPDNADFVGVCDGLQVGFKYKNKPSFVINVWETSNVLPFALLTQATNQRIFGLSNQITSLWHKHGFNNVKTVYGGCDTNFWQQTKPKNSQFTFLHVNSSNVRSGLDITINAFVLAFAGNKEVKLLIKDTNNSPKLIENIERAKTMGANIEYVSKRMSSLAVRDLYSSSHVCLNLLRSTSFGLPLLEASACNCLVLTGDIPPTNELIRPEYGILLPPKGEIPIFESLQPLTEKWGLLNCYPNFEYPEPPRFYTFDIELYCGFLKTIYTYGSKHSKIDTRTPIVENWQWKKSAETLVKYLKNES